MSIREDIQEAKKEIDSIKKVDFIVYEAEQMRKERIIKGLVIANIIQTIVIAIAFLIR